MPRQFLAEQHAYERLQEREAREVRLASQIAEATVEPSHSSEDDLPVAEGNDSEDDEKARSGKENTLPWT